SALLTLDPRLRSVRLLAAADAKFDVGSTANAVQLLAAAEMGRLDGPVRRGLDWQHARLAFVSKRNGDAAERMLRTADDMHQANEPFACEEFLEALVAAIYAGRLGPGPGTVANSMPTDWTGDGIARRLLEGLAARLAQRFAVGRDLLMPLLRAVADGEG